MDESVTTEFQLQTVSGNKHFRPLIPVPEHLSLHIQFRFDGIHILYTLLPAISLEIRHNMGQKGIHRTMNCMNMGVSIVTPCNLWLH